VKEDYGFRGTETRQDFKTGAQRSDATGKGRFDLFSGFADELFCFYLIDNNPCDNKQPTKGSFFDNMELLVSELIKAQKEWEQCFLSDYIMNASIDALNLTKASSLEEKYEQIKRIAVVYERGGVARGDRNWEKGIPFSRLISSSKRHMYQYLCGFTDEDHISHCMWNLIAIGKFIDDRRQDLNDVLIMDK
jgi:hypothetical protein